MDSLCKLGKLNQYMDFEVIREEIFGDEPCVVDTGLSDAFSEPTHHCSLENHPIYMASSNGKRVPILKTVLTSACENGCRYCAFNSNREFERISFRPEELADTVQKMYHAKVIQGAFLSSGIAGGGLRTQDRLIKTADILRNKLGYRGYLHLKIMPGAEHAQVERALQLADRVSINLEAPSTSYLHQLAPQKAGLEKLIEPLKWVEEIRCTQSPHLFWNGKFPSTTTQFVVGGAGELDLELLKVSAYLYHTLHLKRAYFSGFRPVLGTPMENQSAVNPLRIRRLYQAGFLLRDYGFEMEDLLFSAEGNLSLDQDPKYAWAISHLSDSPLEINKANFQELIRIPGIGPKGAAAILKARRTSKLFGISELQKLGIQIQRAAPFILVNGRMLSFQLALW